MTATNSRILSIDVECVATSHTHDGRAPCSVAIVDEQCQIIYTSLINPTEKVVSDLYPFTGLRMKDLLQAPTLDEVLKEIHPLFDATTTIVGQSPKNDIEWLKLEKDVHYAQIIDLSDWFKTVNARYGSISCFSLAHEASTLLGIDLNAGNGHLATQDAKASMQLYLKYKDNESGKETARRLLLKTRPGITPAKACNYNYESVCLAGYFPQKCSCNRPSFSDN
ncbi:unnamed protein product [Adineta steineri]|uniref:Exonuclease domain-containing protein n=1 Tax=Adineta steineri TaxID=433720 RepID=A0A815N7Z3_9BILA|nr:unnamed protein product [Adineta steineri]CAF1429901.1 unnamed protein product [Adineta steineri]CAF1432938.1 unnamed protein product [Adineta steineri]